MRTFTIGSFKCIFDANIYVKFWMQDFYVQKNISTLWYYYV